MQSRYRASLIVGGAASFCLLLSSLLLHLIPLVTAASLVGLLILVSFLSVEFSNRDSMTDRRTVSLQLSEVRRREKSLIENAADVICLVDSKGILQWVNPASFSLWGFKQEELLGRNLSDYLKTVSGQTSIESILTSQQSIERIEFEAQFRKKDGTLADMLWSVRWSYSDSGLFCVAHDISDRRKAERLKQEFLAMVSHDLRTPLSSISTSLQVLKEGLGGDLNAQGKQIVEQAALDSKRLLSLIQDLLFLEGMRSGKFELNRQSISIIDLVQKSFSTLSSLAENREILLESRIPGDLLCCCDEQRILQVLINLLENALKFSYANTSIIVMADSDGKSVRLQVINRGRSIPDEFLKSIFEKFEQVEYADQVEKMGSGLGLAICKTIVEQHGGSIEAFSSEEEGTRFVFCLPRI